MPFKIWTVLCFLLAAVGCTDRAPKRAAPVEVSAFSQYQPADGRAYCENLNAALLNEGYKTGILEVPQGSSVATARTIKVFYYHKPFRPDASPVLFFNGGPTYSSHSSRLSIEGMQQKRREWERALDFVFMDQRGTGCSSVYPYTGTVESLLEEWTRYGSRQIVFDAEALRKKLIGDRKWKIFGQSYGAQVVHRYVAEFPQSLISAHAHGGAIGQERFYGFVLRILSQQRVVKEYLKRFPQDAEDLAVAVRLLNRETCFTNTGSSQTLCGRTLI